MTNVRSQHTSTPRSSDKRGTRGFKLYFGVTPFGRPWKKQQQITSEKEQAQIMRLATFEHKYLPRY
jgi:hypothetical protein